jgi:hypothetical protein
VAHGTDRLGTPASRRFSGVEAFGRGVVLMMVIVWAVRRLMFVELGVMEQRVAERLLRLPRQEASDDRS